MAAVFWLRTSKIMLSIKTGPPQNEVSGILCFDRLHLRDKCEFHDGLCPTETHIYQEKQADNESKTAGTTLLQQPQI